MVYYANYIGPLKTSGYQIPTVQRLINDAIFVNGPPIPDPPQQLNLTRQLLFPFMNFSCNGTITNLAFVVTSDNDNVLSLTSWPYFSLWYYHHEGYFKEWNHNVIGPTDSISFMIQPHMIEVNRPLIFNLRVRNVRFRDGDILGVRMHQRDNRGQFNPRKRSVQYHNTVKVLKQTGGYGQTLVCNHQNSGRCREPNEISDKIQEIPYIAIETSKAYNI